MAIGHGAQALGTTGRKPAKNSWHRLIFGDSGWFATIGGLLSGIAATAGLFYAAFHEQGGESSLPSAASIKLDNLPNPFPRCLNVGGSGDVPAGWVLWLAVVDPKQKYYFDTTATVYPDQHRWTAANISVGAQDQGDQSFAIVPILLDTKTSAFVSSVTAYVGFGTLPPRAVQAPSISAKRSVADIAPCPS
jgi:hypothetical protein